MVRMHLRTARVAKGLSQEELGRLLGMGSGGQSYVSLVEGCRKNPGRQIARRLSEILGHPDTYLLDEGLEVIADDQTTSPS